MNDRKELKERNLQAFKNWNVLFYEKLVDFTPLSELVFDEDGVADILFNNQYYYEGRAKEFAAEQLENYWARPQRLTMTPPLPENVDEYAGKFLSSLLTDSIEEEIEFHRNLQSPENYSAVVFGIGLGYHLNEIVEKTDCDALFLADVNLEFLYHSLEVFDWNDLYKRMEDKGGVIRYIIEPSPNIMAQNVVAFIRATNTAAVDGLIVYEHQSNPVIQEAVNKLRDDRQLILSSLGFFYDESLMITNAYKNLKSGKSVIFRNPGPTNSIDIPVFIVGSGPSLDASLPIIKENADKAIIISAGTGIRPLLFEGIVPDFHLEQENIDVELCVTELIKTHDLSSIIFLAATTVVPEISAHFDEAIFYMRSALSPYPLFSSDQRNCLGTPHNTVVNGAFSFAQDAGFRTIYLFGVDCGARDQSSHHSKNAYHFTENAVFVEQEFNIPVKGNFGGIFLTSNGLYESRELLVGAIKLGGIGRGYYNCSDGALIEHTRPLLPKNVSLPEIEDGKERFVRELYELMPVYSEAQFNASWHEEALILEINKFADEIKEQINNIEDFSVHQYITDLLRILVLEAHKTPGRIEQTIRVLMRGSIILSINTFEFYRRRVKNEGKKTTFSELGRKHLVAEIEMLRNVGIGLIKELSASK
jgi:hypothetical protein